MLKPLILVAAVALAGCSAKPVSPEYFGSAERVQAALSNPDVPVLIGRFGTFRPNSAGGVDVRVEFINTSGKTIKYISFGMTPHNSVGDAVKDRISKRSTINVQDTGPIQAGQSNTYAKPMEQPKSDGVWRNTWYNHTIKCASIDRVTIEYMDGSTQTVTDTTPLLTRSGNCRRYDY